MEKISLIVLSLLIFTIHLVLADGELELSSDSPIINLQEEGITIRLLSASDSNATIEVVSSSGSSNSKTISEGSSEELEGFEIFVISSDETNLKKSAQIKIQPLEIKSVENGEEVLLLSYEPIKKIRFYDNIYSLELLGNSGYSITIRITKDDGSSVIKEIYEGTTGEMIDLNVRILVPYKINSNPTYTSTTLSLNKIEEKSPTEDEDEESLEEENNNTVANKSEEIDNDIKELICFSGCKVGDSCLITGYRTSTEYCNIDGNLTLQQKSDSICNNNFECESNVCVSGQCVETALIQKILEWFRKLFS